nr:hypothetical protein CFP56_46506 [Quercus suber]
MFAMLAWSIWNQRNKVRCQEPSCSLHLLAQNTKDLLQEFKLVQPIPPQPVAVPHARWKPPLVDFVKVNVDEAVFADKDKSIGIMKDSGITLALDIGFHKVVVEGDLKAVMMVLRKAMEIFTRDGLLFEDIRFSSTLFTKLHYSHTKRERNTVAYSLEKCDLHVSDVVVWMEDVPLNVVSVLQANLAHIH